VTSETSLSLALEKLGYARTRAWVFRLDQNAKEVEHFLYFTLRQEKNLIAAHFGFRLPDVEPLAITAFSYFARADFPLHKMLEPDNCSMRYSFGRFHSMLRPGYWNLSNEVDWTAPIVADLNQYLLPFVSRLPARQDMFEVLVANDEPCPWFAANAAIRAAQILFLGSRLCKPRSQLHAIVESRRTEIARDLVAEDKSASVEQFVERTLQEAAIN
jgi:hypothetical protein